MAYDNLPEHPYDYPDTHGTPWPGSPEARSYFASGEWDETEPDDTEQEESPDA